MTEDKNNAAKRIQIRQKFSLRKEKNIQIRVLNSLGKKKGEAGMGTEDIGKCVVCLGDVVDHLPEFRQPKTYCKVRGCQPSLLENGGESSSSPSG